MAEYCIDCAKECLGLTDSELHRVVLSKEPDLCEGCDQWRQVAVRVRPTFREKVVRWLRDRGQT